MPLITAGAQGPETDFDVCLAHIQRGTTIMHHVHTLTARSSTHAC
jgi:hypothetical protein